MRRRRGGARAAGWLLLALLVAVLPRRPAGRRLGAAASSNGTAPSWASLPEALPRVAEAAHATARRYLGHGWLSVFANLWLVHNNFRKLRSLMEQRRAVRDFGVTGEYFSTLERLQHIDRLFTRALKVNTGGAKTWTCEQYYPHLDDQPTLELRRRSFLPGRTFETANDARCVADVKDDLSLVRWSICHIESWAKSWAEEVTIHDVHSLFVDFVVGKSCRGDLLDAERLDPHFRPQPGRVCVAHREATACAKACGAVPECSAVTYRSKRRECCFLQGVVRVVKRSPWGRAESCFQRLGVREAFLVLDPDGVSVWLEANGFGAYSERARVFGGFGLTGFVLSFVTEPTLEKWLGASAADARRLRRRIVAELDGDPGRDVEEPPLGLVGRVSAAWPVTRHHVNLMLLWRRYINRRSSDVRWVTESIRRWGVFSGVRGWAGVADDAVIAWRNTRAMLRMLESGPSGMRDPWTLLRTLVVSTSLWKFRETSAMLRCVEVRRRLRHVVRQVGVVAMRQRAYMVARANGVK